MSSSGKGSGTSNRRESQRGRNNVDSQVQQAEDMKVEDVPQMESE